MNQYLLRIDIAMNLEDHLSKHNRKGTELVLGGFNMTDEEIAGSYGDFISLLIEKGLMHRKEINIVQSSVLKNQNEHYNETILEKDMREVDDDILEDDGYELDGHEDDVLQKPFIVDLCSKVFQIVSETGVIETVIFNSEDVDVPDIGFGLRKLVGIDISNDRIKLDRDMEKETCSIGYEILGEKDVAILKCKPDNGEGEKVNG